MNTEAYVPEHSRPFFGSGQETYSHQLGISSLPEISNNTNIRMLDIGTWNSTAVESLISRYQNSTVLLLDQSYIDESAIDASKIQKRRVDLDSIESIKAILNEGEFDWVFMNQVLQYVRNPFGLIQYIFKNHIKVWWYLYCNISCNIFDHGATVSSYQLFSIMEDRWEKAGILSESKTWNNMKQFHFHKNSQEDQMQIPDHLGYIEIWNQWFRRQKYSFRNYLTI